MKLREIYELAVKMGIKADPRGDEIVKRILDDNNEELNNLSDNEKEFFDEEKLFNPYADSRILYGDDDREIKKLIVGVDMETQELLLTAELNRRGAAIDLVFSHHPEGVALAALAEVMSLQTDCMELLGVRPAMAEALMSGRIKEVGRSVGVNNHSRAVDAARLLDMPFMCLHTVCDNLVASYLTQLIEEANPKNLGDLNKLILDIPEYKMAAKNNNPPRIDVGDKKAKVGKFFVDFTGGTSGPKESYEKMAEAGVNTIISMHNTDGQIKKAKEINLNLLCAGHMASDSVGINLLLDVLEAKGLEVVPASGVLRYKRN